MGEVHLHHRYLLRGENTSKDTSKIPEELCEDRYNYIDYVCRSSVGNIKNLKSLNPLKFSTIKNFINIFQDCSKNSTNYSDYNSILFNTKLGIKKSCGYRLENFAPIETNSVEVIDSCSTIYSPLVVEYIYANYLFKDSYNIKDKVATIQDVEYTLSLEDNSIYEKSLPNSLVNPEASSEEDINSEDYTYMYKDIYSTDGTNISAIPLISYKVKANIEKFIDSTLTPEKTYTIKYTHKLYPNFLYEYLSKVGITSSLFKNKNPYIIGCIKEKTEAPEYSQTNPEPKLETNYYNALLTVKIDSGDKSFEVYQDFNSAPSTYRDKFKVINTEKELNSSELESICREVWMSFASMDLLSEEGFMDRKSYTSTGSDFYIIYIKSFPIPAILEEVEEGINSAPESLYKVKDISSGTAKYYFKNSDPTEGGETSTISLNYVPLEDIRYCSVCKVMPDTPELRKKYPTSLESRKIKKAYESLGILVSESVKRKEKNHPTLNGGEKSKDMIENFKTKHPLYYYKVYMATYLDMTPFYFKAARASREYKGLLRTFFSFWEHRLPIKSTPENRYVIECPMLPGDIDPYIKCAPYYWRIHMYKKEVTITNPNHPDSFIFFQVLPEYKGELWLCMRVRVNDKENVFLEYGLNFTYYFKNISLYGVYKMQYEKDGRCTAKWRTSSKTHFKWWETPDRVFGEEWCYSGKGGMSVYSIVKTMLLNYSSNSAPTNSKIPNSTGSFTLFIPTKSINIFGGVDKTKEALHRLITKYYLYETLDINLSTSKTFKISLDQINNNVYMTTNPTLTHIISFTGSYTNIADGINLTNATGYSSNYYGVYIKGTLSYPIDSLNDCPLPLLSYISSKSGFASVWTGNKIIRDGADVPPPYHPMPIGIWRSVPAYTLVTIKSRSAALIIHSMISVYQGSWWVQMRGITIAVIAVIASIVFPVLLIVVIGAILSLASAIIGHWGGEGNAKLARALGYAGSALQIIGGINSMFSSTASVSSIVGGAMSSLGGAASLVINISSYNMSKRGRNTLKEMSDSIDSITDNLKEETYENRLKETPEGLKDKSVINKSDIGEYFSKIMFLSSQEGVFYLTVCKADIANSFLMQNSAYDYSKNIE